MLKRFSSLILVLVVGGSVFAGTARLRSEHVCAMSGMEMMPNMETMPGMKMSGMENMAGMDMPDMEMSDMEEMSGMDMSGMETMPCCQKNQAEATTEEPTNMGECCVTIPQEPGSTATTINRSSSFSIAITLPAVLQPALSLPKPATRPHVTQLFLPNLQDSYVRNLSFLI